MVLCNSEACSQNRDTGRQRDRERGRTQRVEEEEEEKKREREREGECGFLVGLKVLFCVASFICMDYFNTQTRDGKCR